MGVMNECGLGCWALRGERGVCSLHWALCLFLGSCPGLPGAPKAGNCPWDGTFTGSAS